MLKMTNRNITLHSLSCKPAYTERSFRYVANSVLEN
jgi:hypothetical protein